MTHKSSSLSPGSEERQAPWKKYLIGIGLFMAFLLVLSLFGENGLIKMFNLAYRHSVIEDRIGKLRKENEEFQAKMELLQEKEYYVEESVRNVLGLVGQNEIIYEFDKPDLPKKTRKK